jgi:hypothetical protein
VRSALGRIDGAREDLEAAVAADPSLGPSLEPAIAEVKAAIERREAAQQRAADEAAAAEERERLEAAEKRVAAVEEDTGALEAAARKAFPAEVVPTFLDLLRGRKAAADGPRAKARLYALSGALGVLDGRPDGPRSDYEAAVAADSTYAGVFALRAADRAASLDPGGAVESLETAIRLAPGDAATLTPLLERERAEAEELRKTTEPPKEGE